MQKTGERLLLDTVFNTCHSPEHYRLGRPVSVAAHFGSEIRQRERGTRA